MSQPFGTCHREVKYHKGGVSMLSTFIREFVSIITLHRLLILHHSNLNNVNKDYAK